MRLTMLLVPVALLVAQNRPAPIENEYVRAFLATDAPADKPGRPHEHKQNRVMVYLDSGDIQLKYADGKVENQHWKPGDVAWSPASGTHTSQNVSTRPIRIVEIEIRQPGHGDENAPPDRTHAVIDNSQVRVYRASRAPAGKHFLAVDIAAGEFTWDKLPSGSGPFIITELK
jgi:uncharacterized RmlC-like cupin family protein